MRGYLAIAAALMLVSSAYADSDKRPLTVPDAIQTTRAMLDFQRDGLRGQRVNRRGALTSLLAPAGDRYAMMLITGDLARNGNWVSVYAGRISRTSAESPALRFKGFTHSLGGGGGGRWGDAELVLPGHNPLRWYPTSREVTFFWPDSQGRRQVIAVQVDTGTQRYLTGAKTDVMEYSIRSDGLLLYAARQPTSSVVHRRAEERGFIVQNADALSLLRGEFGGGSIYDSLCNNERFIQPSNAPAIPVRSDVSSINRFLPIDHRVPPLFSPDGKYAIYARTPDFVPGSWDAYTESFTRLTIQASRGGNDALARQVQQLFMLDLSSGEARPLWDAPLLWYPNWKSKAVHLAWSPDSRHVLLAPTFLPVSMRDSGGLSGDAVAVVDALDGTAALIPLRPESAGVEPTQAIWRDRDTIQIRTADADILTYLRRQNHWALALRQKAPFKPSAQGVKIELRQSAAVPPKLYARFPHNRRDKLLFDLNPGLVEKFELGRTEPFAWTDSKRRRWAGRLYYPTSFQSGSRFPIVLQTHGYAKIDEFSLTGLGESEGHPGLATGISIYAAQPLANRGMFVLQIEDRQEHLGTTEESIMFADAYQKAVAALDVAGLIDLTRVGVSGFSRTGWNVEYALTHSDFPYRAALVSDNIDAGYLQWLMAPGYGEPENEAAPFGEGLRAWLERAPAFNVERIRTPLRIQVESGTESILFSGWEMLVRLRQLNRPVEMAVIPDISHGSHNIQSPRQALFSQEGAVEWFDYWLNDDQGRRPEKIRQYERWGKLRAL
jgi:hypothetical protein